MSKSIHSYFKSSEKDSSSSSTHTVNKTVNRTVNKDSSSSNTVNRNDSNIAEMPKLENPTIYQPPENFIFPKTLFGSRERQCHSHWFKNFQWLLYDIEKDSVLCYFCTLHEDKLSAEHNKDPAYISTGFKNWKKAPKCFKHHEQTKCHKAALTYQILVPKCADVDLWPSGLRRRTRDPTVVSSNPALGHQC